MATTTFEARYKGTCHACEVPIRPGDEVVYAGDTLVHVACEVNVEAAGRVSDTCQKCWQTKSNTGACACDESW